MKFLATKPQMYLLRNLTFLPDEAVRIRIAYGPRGKIRGFWVEITESYVDAIKKYLSFNAAPMERRILAIMENLSSVKRSLPQLTALGADWGRRS